MVLIEKIMRGGVAWPCGFLTIITNDNEIWRIINYYHGMRGSLVSKKVKTYIGFTK